MLDVVRVLSEPMSKLDVTVSSVSWVMLDVVRVLSEPMSKLDVKVSSVSWVMLDVVRVLSEPMSKLEVKVSSVSWKMLDAVIVPVILRLDSSPLGGSMAAAVSVNPEAITRLELMVTGEAPTMLDAVSVAPGPMSKSDVTVIFDPWVMLEVVMVPATFNCVAEVVPLSTVSP